jgi:hypothetical protein
MGCRTKIKSDAVTERGFLPVTLRERVFRLKKQYISKSFLENLVLIAGVRYPPILCDRGRNILLLSFNDFTMPFVGFFLKLAFTLPTFVREILVGLTRLDLITN